MKKVIVFFLLFSLLFPSVAFAESENTCSPVLTDEKKEMVQKFQDEDSSLQEAYTIDIIQAIWNAVNINTLNTLIFGNPYCIWFDNPSEELVLGIYTEEQKSKIVDPVFSMFTGLFMLLLLISMMLTGMKMGLKPLGTKVQLTEELIMYLSVCVLFIGYWLIIEQVLNINWAITGTFKDFLLSQGIDLGSSTLVATQDDFNFTDIIIIFAEWVLMLFLNFVYILRTFMITILLCLGGLAILSLLFESTRSYFGTWIQDFIGAVFVQSIHALYLTIVLLFVAQLEGETAVVFKLLLLVLFIPLTSAIMNWMNLSSGDLATSVGMSGVNSLAGAVAMSKKLSHIPKGKGGIPKQPQLSSLKTSRISEAGKGGNSKPWQMAKSVTSKVGMGVGAAAGSVLGPGGMMLGASVGGMAGKGLLQVPRNVAGGIKGTMDTVKGVRKDGFKNVMGDLQKRRMYFGEMGESLGTMIGAGGAGRGVGDALSGVSRQRLANSTENGGLGGGTLESLAKKHPGANVSFMQTNQGSGFYMNDGTQLISPMGAADTNLANGEVRKVDYQFGNSEMSANSTGNYSMNNLDQGSLVRNSDAYLQNANGEKFNDPRLKASSIVPDDYFRSGMRGAEQRNMSDSVADKIGRHPGFV